VGAGGLALQWAILLCLPSTGAGTLPLQTCHPALGQRLEGGVT
jgi:hypothetical protein